MPVPADVPLEYSHSPDNPAHNLLPVPDLRTYSGARSYTAQKMYPFRTSDKFPADIPQNCPMGIPHEDRQSENDCPHVRRIPGSEYKDTVLSDCEEADRPCLLF